MQYMLNFYQPMSEFERRDDPRHKEAFYAAWMAYIGTLRESGLVVHGNGLLSPETGVFVKIRNGRRQVQDGPFPDTKEHLAGYFILEAPSLDTVLEWAARAPSSATGMTEVRPVMDTSKAMPQ
ncbi:MAG TPA: YciI family protein [Burkholderiales bacterium]|jgi:hypothetical protein